MTTRIQEPNGVLLLVRSVVLLLIVCFAWPVFAQSESVNLAEGKKYTISPPPSYHLCTDSDDKIQLTDGQTTTSYFWTQQGTVGWQNVPFSLITVDLGAIEPISGFEFTTAAKAGGVEWPLAILVQSSEDGKTFRQVCNLVEDDISLQGPFPEKYAIRCLKSKTIQTKGRFVRFMAIGTGTFIFCDEVRVLRGSADNLDRPAVGDAVDQPDVQYKLMRTALCIKNRYRDDAAAVRLAIANASISDQLKTEMNQEIDEFFGRPITTADSLPLNFRAILPLDANHQTLYAIQAKLWRALGVAPLTAVSEPAIWSPLNRFAVPVGQAINANGDQRSTSSQPISIVAMQNETRSGAFNLYNSTEKIRDIPFILEELDKSADVTVYQVDWTDTSNMEPVAAALTELKPTNGLYVVSVYPGLVRQIWLSVKTKTPPDQKKKQEYNGSVRFAASQNSGLHDIPVCLTIYPQVFPDKTKLLVGGWDYTNGMPSYNVTKTNKASFLSHVQARGVNCPWGSPSLLAAFTADKDLNVTIDPTDFDAWLNDWSGASEYAIFLAKGGWSSKTASGFKGYAIDSPEFKTLVSRWIAAWAKHWESRGIDSRKVHLLIYDEPNDSTTPEALDGIVRWIDAIKTGCPNVNIWVDPCFRDFKKADNLMVQRSNVLCPNRPMWLENRVAFDQFYLNRQKQGATLHLYSCSGPARLLDPYAYYRLQAWEAARIGAKASFFWALGDGGGVSSWNEYYLGRNAYCPLFIDPADSLVTGAKQMEGIAQGAQDYEYILLLKAKIDQMKESNPVQAQKMTADLNALIESVLYAENAEKLDWLKAKDSNRADKARVQILDWLNE